MLRVIREVLSFEPSGRHTHTRAALQSLTRALHRRSVIFLLSDFFGEDLQVPLAIANRRHDVIAVHLLDPRQALLPPVGWLRLEEAESGRQVVLDSRSPKVREAYARWGAAHRERVRAMTRAAGVDLVEVWTDKPYTDPLLKFFRMRALRR